MELPGAIGIVPLGVALGITARCSAVYTNPLKHSLATGCVIASQTEYWRQELRDFVRPITTFAEVFGKTPLLYPKAQGSQANCPAVAWYGNPPGRCLNLSSLGKRQTGPRRRRPGCSERSLFWAEAPRGFP